MAASSVLNIECTKSSVHCTSKKRALEIISELAAKQLNLPSQVVFDAVLTRERMGSTGIGNGIAIPHGKLEEDTLRAVGVFIRLDQPIAFDAIDNQPVDLLFALLVPADQCKTHLHTLSLVAKRLADKTVCQWVLHWSPNAWPTKPYAAACAPRKATKNFTKSSPSNVRPA